jgi:hypothetical protein
VIAESVGNPSCDKLAFAGRLKAVSLLSYGQKDSMAPGKFCLYG